MRKYFTWRCLGLHALVIVLVPACLVAGWWQYHVAMGGNDLGWVYTVEWPFFAVYGAYIWWKLIHDESTPFDRLWAAKQRAAADANGRPLHEIPGWATDKALSRDVYQASIEAARRPALAVRRQQLVPALPAHVRHTTATSDAPGTGSAGDREVTSPPATVIDAEVVGVKVVVDEELDAYNRYLADLAWRDPPKRWGPGRQRSGQTAPVEDAGTAHTPPQPALPPGGDSTPAQSPHR